MKAARFYGIHDLRWEDIEEPSCRPGAVKVRVAYNGICGTDVHEFFDGPVWTPVEPHPLTGQTLPVTFGHEFAGTIVEIGGDVTSLKVGDRVAVETTVSCGKCHSCLTGDYNLCVYPAWIGLTAPGGGLAEYCIVDEERAHLLPESVTLEQGAVVEPFSVALHAVRRVSLKDSDVVAVHGGGPIGIGVAYGASAAGVAEIIVTEVSEYRRRIVESLGIPRVRAILDPTSQDVYSAIRDMTGGRGVDVSFDAAGAAVVAAPDGQPAHAFSTAAATTKRHGWMVNVATHPTTTFEPNIFTFSELHITGSAGFRGVDFKTVIERVASGVYSAEGWVQHFPADQLVEAFTLLHEGGAAKILIDLPQ
jgi:(R,R)-butanediol dehydrogenase/meso-butanediol dehydrogenase/diacetyl reductase